MDSLQGHFANLPYGLACRACGLGLRAWVLRFGAQGLAFCASA